MVRRVGSVPALPSLFAVIVGVDQLFRWNRLICTLLEHSPPRLQRSVAGRHLPPWHPKLPKSGLHSLVT
jgi:hypothetical protein